MTNSSQAFECLIESLGYKGEGICRRDGQVVFVNHALPGERVKISINRSRKNLAFADLLQVLVPSSQRVQPVCPHFAVCGGCAVQHMDAALQHSFKRQAVEDNLKRIAGTSMDVQEVIGMEDPFAYRNKTTWQLRLADGEVIAGFFAPGSHRVVPVKRCFIASVMSNAAKDVLVRWLNTCSSLGLLPDGLPVQQFVARSNQAGDVLLILRTSIPSLPRLDQLIEDLKSSLPRFVGLCSTTLSDEEDSVQDAPVDLLYGTPFLKEHLLGLDFQISPLSFFQVNHKVCEALYAYALQEAIRSEQDVLLDLYSGAGTISLIAAKRCREVVGIEYAPEAVRDANNNARINRIDNARFYSSKAEDIVPGLLKAGFKPNAVILDPPRKGAHPAVLAAITQARPERVVYISCHPASQARDAAILTESGYEAVKSQPFDMFPQTAEIENVITFVRSAT